MGSLARILESIWWLVAFIGAYHYKAFDSGRGENSALCLRDDIDQWNHFGIVFKLAELSLFTSRLTQVEK